MLTLCLFVFLLKIFVHTIFHFSHNHTMQKRNNNHRIIDNPFKKGAYEVMMMSQLNKVRRTGHVGGLDHINLNYFLVLYFFGFVITKYNFIFSDKEFSSRVPTTFVR